VDDSLHPASIPKSAAWSCVIDNGDFTEVETTVRLSCEGCAVDATLAPAPAPAVDGCVCTCKVALDGTISSSIELI
jgi:hypothetical protein